MTSYTEPEISKRAVPGLALALALAAITLTSACGDPEDSSQILLGNKTVQGAAVKGTMIAELQASNDIELPDVELTLTELSDPSITVTGQSDIQGRFALWPPQPGDYELCWQKPGWISQCLSNPITIAVGQGASLGYLSIQADYELSGLRGTVTLADGAPCAFLSPYFGITQVAQVHVDVAGITYDVRGNINGEYAVGGVPQGNDVTIHASCGRVTSTVNIPASQLDTSGATAYDVSLPNHAPTARPYASLGGKGVSSAALGEVLEVVANADDADGDSLYYEWKVASTSSGTITNFGTPTAFWMLWGTPGYKSAYVLVRDENDLYREARAQVVVDASGVIFAGTVTDESNIAIADATVTVTPFQENTPREPLSAQTDAQGGFTIPMLEAERYHISIQKPGVCLLFRGRRSLGAGRTWRLRSAFVARGVDPNETIDVTEERRAGDGDGGGRELPGVRLIIPPGSLVDKADGVTLPPGPVDVYLATIDPSEMAMPGDQMLSRNLDGEEGYLVSLGAAMVEVRDAVRDYTINGEAQLFIPITQTLRDAEDLPNSVAMWTLDEETGVWQQDFDQAERQGESYTTIIRHLSVFNLDIEKNDPACMRINVDNATVSLPLDVQIKIKDISQNIDQTVTKTLNDPLNVLYRLPPHALITVKPLDSQGNVIAAAQPPTTSSGATATNGQGNTVHFPASPYTECNSEVTISLVPQWSGYPSSPFLTFEGTPPSSNSYYNAIDPNNDKTNLGDWWDENGFNATDGSGSGVVSAQYFNGGDLGFGRNMNCLQTGLDVACWVSNYPDADSAYNHDVAYSFATVAMEYSAVTTGGTRFVKFYVFDGENPSSARVDFANLDGFGNKFVPYLCMSCHGGSHSGGTFSTASANLGASFLPFDLETFDFPAAINSSSTPVQQAFFNLNTLVQATNPNQAISDIISAWYDKSPAPSGPPYDGTKTINDWGTGPQNALYNNVVKGACRGCHQAQEDIVDFSTYNQSPADDFKGKRSAIQGLVCSGKSMPHAFVTYRNFWLSTSPSQPNTLANYSDGPGWTAFGTCQ